MRGGLGRLLLGFILTTSATSPIRFHGTDRLPKASGEATVDRVGTSTRIHVALEEMKPAMLFGGDFNTYVVWAVSSPSEVENLGECVLVGTRCRLDALVTAGPTSMFVTAEPHFLVSVPSRFVVLEPQPASVHRYQGNRTTYNYERDTLEKAKEAKGAVDNNVRQAMTAVRLARRAGAAELAPDEFRAARNCLQLLLSNARQDPKDVEAGSRETVRLAVAAQQIADQRAHQR